MLRVVLVPVLVLVLVLVPVLVLVLVLLLLLLLLSTLCPFFEPPQVPPSHWARSSEPAARVASAAEQFPRCRIKEH